MSVDINKKYVLSENVVLREIEGEAILVPIAAGIGDMEDELYTLNETGKAILSMLDGKKSLKKVAEDLLSDYEMTEEELTTDVKGFADELYRRKILVEVE